MKLTKFLLTPPLAVISVALCAALSSFGATCTYNGAWDTAPAAGDDIVITGGTLSWTADMPHQVASWTQFDGTVTFETTYGDTFPKLEVTGNVVLEGGTWTHKANPACDVRGTTSITYHRDYRLYVSVGGALTIGQGATVSAKGLGYNKPFLKPEGQPGFLKLSGYLGGSHGGLGAWNKDSVSSDVTGDETYDSIVAPVEPGGGGSSKGGGAIRLDVGGALALDGAIDADGATGAFYTGAGGSVYIRAGTISGAGTITARALTTGGYEFGGGGRIAIILTGEGADFTAFDPAARCSAMAAPINAQGALFSNAKGGGPGTIYAETPADDPGKGWLILKDNGYGHNRQPCNADPFNEDGTFGGFARLSLLNGAQALVREGESLDLGGTVVETDATSCLQILGGSFVAPPTGVSFNIAIVNSPSTYEGDLLVNEGAVVTDDAGLTVTGNLVLNGTMTRSGPFDLNPLPFELTVGGDFTIGSAGRIDVSSAGYTANFSPEGVPKTVSQKGGSHGGRGSGYYENSSQSNVPCFDSIVEPLEPGAGGAGGHGGATILLSVDGALVNGGTILSSATTVPHYAGSGGTVNIRAGSLSGAGRISADGGAVTGAGGGGGGRVAIRLTDAGADFSSYTGPITAYGAYEPKTGKSGRGSGAGTVWLSTAAQGEAGGTLVVDNGGEKAYTLIMDTELCNETMPRTVELGDVFIGSNVRCVLASGGTMVVSGILTNGSAFVAEEGSTVRFAGTGTSRLTGGDFTFANFAAEAPGKTIVVDDGATIEVTGDGVMTGAANDNLVLVSATQGQPWTLKGANVSLTGVALRDCQSETPITVMNGTDLGGNSANITFVNIKPGELITWTGAADAAWGNAANWDRARTPIATDKVTVPAGAANQPTLATDTTVAEIAVAADASLSLGGKKLTVTGDATFAGELICSGVDVLDVKGDLALASVVAAQSTVRLSGEEQALTFNGTALYALELKGGAVTVAGDFSAVTLTVGDGEAAFDVAFAEGMTVTATAMTVAGDPDEKTGFLRCATSGEQWNLICNDAHVSDVTVSGSDASKGVTVVPTDCTDGGDNVNWLFVDDRTHWTGEVSSDFADPANWSDGVPSATKDAVVEGDVPCVISSAAAAGKFTVNPDAQVTVNADFTVNGPLTILSGATVAWNVPGEVTGNLVILSGATLTHDGNTTTEANKLNLTVGGTGYVAAGAAISADGKGYKGGGAGPAPASSGAELQYGASHGGHGFHAGGSIMSASCYGSALRPVTCGSSGADLFAGGGAVRMVFAGTLQIDGRISADAQSGGSHYTGAGGSVWLTAPALIGVGKVSATGGNGSGYGFGGGGRVAIYLTGATEQPCAVTVHGGKNINTSDGNYGKIAGGSGTYYLETANDSAESGTLFVGAPGEVFGVFQCARQAKNDTAELDALELAKAKVVVQDCGAIAPTGDTKIAALVIDPDVAGGYVRLNGWTLRVHERHHALGVDESVQVVPGTRTDPETGDEITGEIIWSNPGLMIFVR